VLDYKSSRNNQERKVRGLNLNIVLEVISTPTYMPAWVRGRLDLPSFSIETATNRYATYSAPWAHVQEKLPPWTTPTLIFRAATAVTHTMSLGCETFRVDRLLIVNITFP
jgi:hypothetical protein